MSIEAYPSPNGVLTSLIWRKTAAGSETSLSGYDNASQALSYTPGQEQVYLNGILLVRGDDYTATNGTSITGLSALTAGDYVQVNCYNNFSVASLPAASITGEVTNSQITSLATTKLTGTITNAQLAGSIANDKLTNSSITINGSAVALGGSATIAGGSAQDTAPSSPTEGQLWLDTDGTLATTAFVEKSTLTTTGDLLYASSANTPARIGIGSTGNVLTVSGGLPVWSAPAAGANWTLLNSGGTTLTGASTITVSSISGKDKIMVIIDDADSDTNDDISVRINTDTGNNYFSWGSIARIGGTYGGNNYTGVNSTNAYGGPGNAANNRIYLGRTSANANSRVNGYVLITGCNSSGVKVYNSHGMGTYSEDIGHRGLWLGGYYNSASTVSSVSVVAGASFDGGKIYVYASA